MAKKKEREFILDDELKAQPDFVVCWIYNEDTGELIDKYRMPNNKDKLEVHLPPNATLKKPPEHEKGFKPFFVNDRWELRPKEPEKKFKPVDDHELKIDIPVLQKKLVADPQDATKTIETFEWVTTQITPEGEAERSRARREAFLKQQREWGLEE